MDNSKLAMIGALIGFSVALSVILLSDKQLKKEASDQLGAVLKSTKKVVKHYRNATQLIAPEQFQATENKTEVESAWDNVISTNKKYQDEYSTNSTINE